jgi:hypothetical protein
MKVLDKHERLDLVAELASQPDELVYARVEGDYIYCTVRKKIERLPDVTQTHTRDGITIKVAEHFRKAAPSDGVRHDVFDGAVLLNVDPPDRVEEGTALFQELYKGRTL